jgi:hypothetical protein
MSLAKYHGIVKHLIPNCFEIARVSWFNLSNRSPHYHGTINYLMPAQNQSLYINYPGSRYLSLLSTMNDNNQVGQEPT